MPILNIRYRKILSLVIIVVIIFLAFLNIKWIGKQLYPVKYKEHILKYSNEYELDPLLVASIILVESKYYKDAESHKGARGLMQVSLGTGRWAAERIGIDRYTDELLYDPQINILIGCWYLNNLKKQFNNEISVVIAAYNGGSGNVTKWLNNKEYSSDGETLDYIPFRETEQYVEKVLKSYKVYKFLYSDLYNVS